MSVAEPAHLVPAQRVSGIVLSGEGVVRLGGVVDLDPDQQAVGEQAGQRPLALRRRPPRSRPAGAAPRRRGCRGPGRAAGRGTAGRCRRTSAPCAAGPSYAGWPAARQRAPVGDRAAAGSAGSWRCTPARRAPSPRPPRWPRSARPRAAASVARSRSARVTAAAGNSTPLDRAGEDPAHVGVEHDVAPAEGERRDRRRGVVADARQRQQLGVRPRAPRRRARPRSRWPRRAAAAPAAGSRAGPRPAPPRRLGRGQRRRRRPAAQPGLVHRQHPGHRRLLEHELRDHHRPRASRRYAARAGRARARRTSRGRGRGGRSSRSDASRGSDARASTVSHPGSDGTRWLPWAMSASPVRAARCRPASTGPGGCCARCRASCWSSASPGCSAAAATARPRPTARPRRSRGRTATRPRPTRPTRRRPRPRQEAAQDQEGESPRRRRWPSPTGPATAERHRRCTLDRAEATAGGRDPDRAQAGTTASPACTWHGLARDAVA